jgi:hypothetical protein
MALPQPVAIEALKDQQVIATIDNATIINALRFIDDDFLLAEVIHIHGNDIYVTKKTEGTRHTLSTTAPSADWFDRYHTRVADAIAAVQNQ